MNERQDCLFCCKSDRGKKKEQASEMTNGVLCRAKAQLLRFDSPNRTALDALHHWPISSFVSLQNPLALPLLDTCRLG